MSYTERIVSPRGTSDDFITTKYEHVSKIQKDAQGRARHYDDDIVKKPRKLGKRVKLRQHCSRFWCCWAVFLVATLAIGLPILFLVILPALAQRIVNDTSLPIYAADLRPINSTALRAGLSTGLSLPGGLNVKLDACDLWLYNPEKADVPYARVPIPDQYLTGGSGGGALQINDVVGQVTDDVEINKWLTKILNDKEASISVRTTTTAWLGAIKIPLKLDKTVTTPALRELEGTELTEARIYLPPQPDGANIAGTMLIPNYSIMTMDLGNVTLNAMSGDILIGKVELQNALLHPGNQTLPFRGEIFLDKVLSNITGIIASQTDSVFKGVVTLTASGNQTVINNQHITYLEDALSKARINVEVPIAQLISDVVGSFSAGILTVDSVFQEILDGFVGQNTTISNILDDFTEGQDGTPGGLWNDVLSNWNVSMLDAARQNMRVKTTERRAAMAERLDH